MWAASSSATVDEEGDNVAVCGIRGNFDDAQSAVKRIFADKELAERLEAAGTVLSSANSINVGRLVPQVVYYFAAYAQLLRAGAIEAGDAVEFCVPTGNFGDILAGYYAKRMGLPVAKLIVASDKNNVLADFLTTGVYDRNRPFFTTISPSMDILISSNLERMLYFLSDGDCELVAGLMEQLAQTGRYELPAELLAKIQSVFGCGWASEDEVRAAIKSCWDANGYVIDPHTACGYHVFEQVASAEGAKARSRAASRGWRPSWYPPSTSTTRRTFVQARSTMKGPMTSCRRNARPVLEPERARQRTSSERVGEHRMRRARSSRSRA